MYCRAFTRLSLSLFLSLSPCSTVEDSRLHFNVLVFQQSLSCDCDADDVTRPLAVSAAKWRHLLPYWLCRITAALNESRAGSAHGVYDAATRQRLVARIQERSGDRPGSGGDEPLLVQPQAWTPPPLPTAVLTRS